MKDNNIILASASPRRRELLKLIFEDFEVFPSDIPEVVPNGISPEEQPRYLACIKAEDIAQKFPEKIVIGADTSVLTGERILGKPKTKAEAREMLLLLSGNTHKVITGCAVIIKGVCHSFSVTTEVEFLRLTASEIEEYIESGEPFDKAGGYGIQSKGGLFVRGIIGDYFNVVGLPVAVLNKKIQSLLKNT